MGRLSRGLVALAAAAAAAIVAAAPAAAADLPVAPAPSPPVYRPAVYDWSGIYLGGSAGAGLVEDSVTATASTLEATGSQVSYSPFSVVGGLQAGVNVQFDPVVVGIEADWIASYISGSQTANTLIATFNDRVTSAPHWYTTVTGRLGYAAGDALFYAKGGAAFMRVDYTLDLLNTAGAVVSTDILSVNRTGFTVGGGIEYAFNEYLSARLEYDFLDFGSRNYAFNFVANAPGVAPFAIQSNTSLFTLGFDYRYNWVQRSPLAAKY